jgi:hypothetical protein
MIDGHYGRNSTHLFSADVTANAAWLFIDFQKPRNVEDRPGAGRIVSADDWIKSIRSTQINIFIE